MNNELVEAVARQLAFELTYSLGDRALHAAARKAIALIRPATLAEAAKVADAYEPRCDVCPRGVAAAIRALKDEA